MNNFGGSCVSVSLWVGLVWSLCVYFSRVGASLPAEVVIHPNGFPLAVGAGAVATAGMNKWRCSEVRVANGAQGADITHVGVYVERIDGVHQADTRVVMAIYKNGPTGAAGRILGSVVAFHPSVGSNEVALVDVIPSVPYNSILHVCFIIGSASNAADTALEIYTQSAGTGVGSVFTYSGVAPQNLTSQQNTHTQWNVWVRSLTQRTQTPIPDPIIIPPSTPPAAPVPLCNERYGLPPNGDAWSSGLLQFSPTTVFAWENFGLTFSGARAAQPFEGSWMARISVHTNCDTCRVPAPNTTDADVIDNMAAFQLHEPGTYDVCVRRHSDFERIGTITVAALNPRTDLSKNLPFYGTQSCFGAVSVSALVDNADVMCGCWWGQSTSTNAMDLPITTTFPGFQPSTVDFVANFGCCTDHARDRHDYTGWWGMCS